MGGGVPSLLQQCGTCVVASVRDLLFQAARFLFNSPFMISSYLITTSSCDWPCSVDPIDVVETLRLARGGMVQHPQQVQH